LPVQGCWPKTANCLHSWGKEFHILFIWTVYMRGAAGLLLLSPFNTIIALRLPRPTTAGLAEELPL
jgi:hypothetical protein